MAWNWGLTRRNTVSDALSETSIPPEKEHIPTFLSIWRVQSRNCLARLEPGEDNTAVTRFRKSRMPA